MSAVRVHPPTLPERAEGVPEPTAVKLLTVGRPRGGLIDVKVEFDDLVVWFEEEEGSIFPVAHRKPVEGDEEYVDVKDPQWCDRVAWSYAVLMHLERELFIGGVSHLHLYAHAVGVRVWHEDLP